MTGVTVVAEYRLDQLQVDLAHPLGAGGAAEVFRCTTPAGESRIFKQYNADSLERLDAEALRHLIGWPTHLDADDRTRLLTLCAWPEAIVTTNNKVVGILMPEAPAKFFITRKEQPEPRHSSRVAVKQDRAAKGGYPYYDFPHKIARLGSLLSALQFLHSAQIVIGDLQWNNILTTGTEPYNGATSADVYFVDCDSFIVGGRAPLTNMDPMPWRPPYPTNGFSAITDMYKFALMVIRCLSEQTNQVTIDFSLYKHLLKSSDFVNLHLLLTSPDPGLTSGDLGAMAHAWQASVRRDGRMYRRTDSAAREPWTEAMRSAHLAGLPASTSSQHGTSTSASKEPPAWKPTDPSAQTPQRRPAPYNGGSSARSMTPEEKLASRQWQLLNSWWILPPILSFGILGWLGFSVAAIRTGKRQYWVFCGIYATLFLITFVTVVAAPYGSLAADLVVIPTLLMWLGPTIHAAIENREYLRTLAYKNA